MCEVCHDADAVSDRRSSERDQDQRRRRAARGEPQHAAELGAPLRLPQAAPHAGRPPPVRPHRARVAAPGAARDAQHLLGHRARPPARRGPVLARAACSTPSTTSTRALADRVLEESLAVRSVERTVEEVLLPALELASEREGRDAERELGCRWATGWLHAARRVVPAGQPPAGRAALRLEPAPRPRVAARAGARAGPAPRRLPHAAAGLRPPARARRARHPGARPDRVRVLRRRGHPRGGRPARLHGAPGRLGRPRCSSTARPCRSPASTASRRSAPRRSRPWSGSRATWTAAASSRSWSSPEAEPADGRGRAAQAAARLARSAPAQR